MSRAQKRNKMRRIRRNRRAAVLGCILLCSVFISVALGKTEVTANTVTYKYYTDVFVQSGDTVWDIAERYYTDDHSQSFDSYMKEIKKLNHMKDYTIHYGDVLIVPYYSEEVK